MEDEGIDWGCIIGEVVIFLAVLAAIDYSGVMWASFINPIQEEVRRETFERTKSYNEGKEQDLIRYRLQYLQAETDENKQAIASTIRLMFADYDEELLSDELREFLKHIKYGE